MSNGGTLNLLNTHIAENNANRAGAGIEMIDGTLNVVTSSIRKNFLTKQLLVMVLAFMLQEMER